MTLRILLVYLGFTSAAALGSVPREISGMVFIDTRYLSAGFANSRVLLQPGGACVGLIADRWEATTVVAKNLIPQRVDVRIPSDSTWTYEITGEETARLRIGTRALLLHFTSGVELSGTVTEGSFYGAFRFEPYHPSTRMVNASARAYVTAGRTVSVGFVISAGERRLLVRAVGPGLRAFGVDDALARPVLRLRRANPTSFDQNAAWEANAAVVSDASVRVGAFPLQAQSSDAAFVTTVTAGVYVAEVTSAEPSGSGEVLVEIYELP